MNPDRKFSINIGTDEVEKIVISNPKIGERFKYSTSLGRAVEKSADTLLLKLKRKRLNKNSKTFSDKQLSQSNSSLFEIISPRDEKWQIIQEALTNALLGKTITNLSEVLLNLRQLDEQFITNVIVDFYETHILANTLQKLQRRVNMDQDYENVWTEFFRKSLPNVIMIFSTMKTQQDYVERITLFEFKRRLTTIEDIKHRIIKRKKENSMNWSIIRHMFLILQATRKNDHEITDIDIEFEQIASLLISPLVGYSGIFIDGKLEHKCKNLSISKMKVIPNSNMIPKKDRISLTGVFGESKSLWNISGKF